MLRRVTADDGPLVREIRLAMLADTPLGFLETYDGALALTDQDWRDRAVRGSVDGDSFQVLALLDGPVASSVCFVADEVLWWGGVFVRPASRGSGLLGRLLAQVSGWGRSLGRDALDLEVHEGNPRAIRAYEKLGFTPTGDRRPYPLAPGGFELRMRRPL